MMAVTKNCKTLIGSDDEDEDCTDNITYPLCKNCFWKGSTASGKNRPQFMDGAETGPAAQVIHLHFHGGKLLLRERQKLIW